MTTKTEHKKDYSVTADAAQTSDFDSFLGEMSALYEPEQLSYTPVSEEDWRNKLGELLRPAYDWAIQRRGESTLRASGELDADAFARGMGQSSYVDDMKGRQQEAEDRDVAYLEAEYASTLAEYLFTALQNESERVLEVDKFNAEQRSAAKQQAYDAAWQQYTAQQASGGSKSGASSGSGQTKDTSDTDKTEVTTSYKNIVNLLKSSSPKERFELYYGYGNDRYEGLRNTIRASVSTAEYERLKQQYPANTPTR